jgi:nucleoside-diphosphate-sugar epimerase
MAGRGTCEEHPVKVGVTGGAGFIGGWVVKELRRRGHDPVVFDVRGRTVFGAETMLGDIRDAVAVTELAAHVDGIIHLAAVLGTQETITNPRPAVEVNGIGGANVLAAAHQYGLPLVNIAVGNYWMRNSYSTTKRMVERLVEQYVTEAGAAFANVRCVNAYGPRQGAAPPFAAGKVRKIVPAFACRALAGMPVEVYGDGAQVSDCVFVGDVARVLVRSLEACADGRVPQRTIEVGPVEHHTVNDIAKHVIALAGTGVELVHLPMRPGEQPGARVTADPSTLGDIGMSATKLVPLVDGLNRTVAWFRDNEGTAWRRP